MLEPRRKLGCCASSVECLFFILNIAIFVCSALLGGSAAYFYANPEVPVSLGMEEVRVMLAIIGAALAVLAITGMLVTAQNSHWFTKFYSLLLIIFMVTQCVAGVYLMMLQNTASARIHAAWNHLTPTARHAIELRLICCGLNAVSESPDCIASKTQSCGSTVVVSQTAVLNFLSTTCLVFAAVEIVCLLMAQFLAGQYKNLKAARRASGTLLSPKSVSGESIPMQSAPSPHMLPESFRNHQPVIQSSQLASPGMQTPGFTNGFATGFKHSNNNVKN